MRETDADDLVADVIPLDPLTACMMRHPAGSARTDDGDYPPIRESKLYSVPETG